MIRDEIDRLVSWEERHKRLLARLLLAAALTVIVDLVGTILVYAFEKGVTDSDVHGFGDALFFSTVQLLTVSSQLRNPVTTAGRVVDVALELWAIVVVTTAAGSFAAFFGSADASSDAERGGG